MHWVRGGPRSMFGGDNKSSRVSECFMRFVDGALEKSTTSMPLGIL